MSVRHDFCPHLGYYATGNPVTVAALAARLRAVIEPVFVPLER